MNKKTVRDIDLKGKHVLVRCDFNVPLDDDGNITDDTRIERTLPTLQYLLEQKAKLVLVSHLGRPKGELKPEFSLAPVARRLTERLELPVELLDDCIGQTVTNRVQLLKEGEVVLLENLRFHPEEEKNDPEFAKSLAEHGEVYVNDAFGAAHRAHASTEGVTHFLPSVSGLLLEAEINYFEKILSNPEKPVVAILGGAKVSDKIQVIESLMTRVDALLIGGGMAYTFLKYQGKEIGKSLLDAKGLEVAGDILSKAEKTGVKVLLPVDFITADAFSATAKTQVTESIDPEWEGLDIGPQTRENFKEVLATAKTILWNGPVGVFEWEAFAGGTRALAEFIATTEATSIIGGGDTASAVKQFGVGDKMTHISTGGGASLEFLEGKVLPGIAALEDAECVSNS